MQVLEWLVDNPCIHFLIGDRLLSKHKKFFPLLMVWSQHLCGILAVLFVYISSFYSPSPSCLWRECLSHCMACPSYDFADNKQEKTTSHFNKCYVDRAGDHASSCCKILGAPGTSGILLFLQDS